MSVTWLTPSEVTPGSASAWTDVDVSASVPAGATGVILHVEDTSGYSNSFGVRKNGSTDDLRQTFGAYVHSWYVCGVDANRVFECYCSNISYLNVYLVGYFTDDAAFFTNAVDKSLGSTGSYADIDISSDTGADTAIGAFFYVVGVFSQRFGLRKNGSTDDYYQYLSGRDSIFAVGVDESEICEGKISSTDIDFYLVGYVISDATFNTNWTDYSIGSTESWTDLSALPAGATGGLFHVHPSALSQYNYGLRKNGSSEDITYDQKPYHSNAYVECDGSQVVEGYIEHTNLDFYLIGYTTAAAGGETGTVCWGHSTSVEETVTRVLSGNWTGTGTITGSGDSEKIYLLPGQYMESETWNLTSMKAIINLDKYGSGSGGITVKYKDGNSEANCEADTWHAYSIPFACTGWIKIRIEG